MTAQMFILQVTVKNQDAESEFTHYVDFRGYPFIRTHQMLADASPFSSWEVASRHTDTYVQMLLEGSPNFKRLIPEDYRNSNVTITLELIEIVGSVLLNAVIVLRRNIVLKTTAINKSGHSIENTIDTTIC